MQMYVGFDSQATVESLELSTKLIRNCSPFRMLSMVIKMVSPVSYKLYQTFVNTLSHCLAVALLHYKWCLTCLVFHSSAINSTNIYHDIYSRISLIYLCKALPRHRCSLSIHNLKICTVSTVRLWKSFTRAMFFKKYYAQKCVFT